MKVSARTVPCIDCGANFEPGNRRELLLSMCPDCLSRRVDVERASVLEDDLAEWDEQQEDEFA